MLALGHGTVCFVSLELGSLVLSLRVFFEKIFAVILVEGRGCGSLRSSLRGCYLGAATPRFLAAFHRFCVVARQGLVLSRACSPEHVTAYDLATGPWAMFPRSFSYRPPPSHGMSRLVVGVCLHILKCCLYYFLEILDYISSESLVSS